MEQYKLTVGWKQSKIFAVDSPPSVRSRIISASVNTASSVCNENDFRCNDGKCIRTEWKCDGSGDCSDGEDEKDCRKFEYKNVPKSFGLFQKFISTRLIATIFLRK